MVVNVFLQLWDGKNTSCILSKREDECFIMVSKHRKVSVLYPGDLLNVYDLHVNFIYQKAWEFQMDYQKAWDFQTALDYQKAWDWKKAWDVRIRLDCQRAWGFQMALGYQKALDCQKAREFQISRGTTNCDVKINFFYFLNKYFVSK